MLHFGFLKKSPNTSSLWHSIKNVVSLFICNCPFQSLKSGSSVYTLPCWRSNIAASHLFLVNWWLLDQSKHYATMLKYRGLILCVTSPALGSDELSLDQGTSIQILLEPNAVHVTRFFFIKLWLYHRKCQHMG